MGKEYQEVPEWMKKVQSDEGVQSQWAMAWMLAVKVYNKPMWKNAIEDVTKAGKIIIKPDGKEWIALWEEMNVNILLVRKFYTGFVPRLNEFWDVEQDDNWKAIKDFYYTPEVDVFSKANIPLGKMVSGNRTIVWRDSKQNFDEMCKSPKIDGKVNPLLKEIKTNEQTWDKYPVSYMKLGYVIYVKDTDNDEIYKVIPWGSYGRFNDIQPWTYEDLMLQAKTQYKEIYNDYVVPSFVKSKITVKHEGGFYYLDWKLNWFIVEDNSEEVDLVKSMVEEFNKERFEGIDFDMPMQTLPYSQTNILEAPKEEIKEAKEVKEPKVDWEISVEDIPF